MNTIRERVINLYSNNIWENFLSHFKFWEEPYEVVNNMLPQKGTIIELGCGEGLLSNFIAMSKPNAKIIGYEINPDRLTLARKGIPNAIYKVADVTNLKLLKANSYILFHVLHHLLSERQQEKILKNIKENLLKNGKLIIVEVHVKLSLKYFAAWFADHFLVPWVFENRFFTKAYFRGESEWIKILEKIGYSTKVRIETKGRPFPNIIFECMAK
jgi:ubiquinone/menaquinone biosynthesis C-methylase UbiE